MIPNKQIKKLIKDPSYRIQEGLCVIEGIKMVEESEGIVDLYVTEKNAGRFPSATIISDSLMSQLSSLKTPEGVLATVKIPQTKALTGKIVALDGINDPGNLGTLIRTAHAFGYGGILLLNDTADPYGDKALRAAKGATFRIPLLRGSLEPFRSTHHLYGAFLRGEPPETVQETNILLVLGNEANGISDEIAPLLKPLSLPMKGEMESLNVAVAGGILLYLLQ